MRQPKTDVFPFHEFQYKEVLYYSFTAMLLPTILSYNIMGVSNSLGELSRVIERYESDGGEVQHVKAQMSDRESEAGLNATVEIPVSLCPEENSRTAVSPKEAAITDRGGLQVEFAPSILPDLDEYITEGTSAVEESIRVVEGGTIVMTITLTFEAEMEQRHSEESTSCTTSSHTSETFGVTENDEAVDGDTATADERDATTGVARADDPNSISDRMDTLTKDTKSMGDRTDGKGELDGVRDEDLPLFEDDEYLQYLYDSFRTFEEMAQNVDISVSSETVRRYMIKAGIHEPSTYETADETTVDDDSSTMEDVGNADDEADKQATIEERAEGTQPSTGTESVQEGQADESGPGENLSDPELAADGIGLPDGLTIEELTNAIESSMTVFDVQRKLDLSQERTKKLLKQLNLIDLVVGRLSHHSDQQVTQEEIVNRIRSSTISN